LVRLNGDWGESLTKVAHKFVLGFCFSVARCGSEVLPAHRLMGVDNPLGRKMHFSSNAASSSTSEKNNFRYPLFNSGRDAFEYSSRTFGLSYPHKHTIIPERAHRHPRPCTKQESGRCSKGSQCNGTILN